MATVEIPENLYKKLEKRAKNIGFNNVSEYISFILDEVLRNLEEEEEEKNISDEEKIKERLRALGYLD